MTHEAPEWGPRCSACGLPVHELDGMFCPECCVTPADEGELDELVEQILSDGEERKGCAKGSHG